MNKYTCIGRLTGDPEIRMTADGKKVAHGTVAVDRRFARQEQSADFIRFAAFEKKAEFLEKYCHKGTKLALSGRLQTGSYKDKEGRTVYTTDFIIEEIEFCETKRAQADAATESPAPATSAAAPADDGWVDVPLDDLDLPFS